MSIIEDGKGSGKKAGVNDANRLDVSAQTEDRIYYVSRDDKKAFAIYGRRNFIAGSDTNENILYVKYTGNTDLHIKDITFSTNSPNAKIEIFFDPTNVSGGEVRLPLNLNRTSAITSETICLTGEADLTADTITANEFMDVRLNLSTFTNDFHSALILPKNASILVKGSVETAGEKIRVMIYYYEGI